MPEAVTRLPVKNEAGSAIAAPARNWRPFESLQREVDRLFEDFEGRFWRMPQRQSLFDYIPFGRTTAANVPAVDIAEKDNQYEVTAELPGLDEKDIEVKLSNGGLMIRGEKKEEKEEKKRDYYLSERRYGSFERFFAVPDGVDVNKISAKFTKGVLTIMLPKTVEAQKHDKKIEVKAA